jgi:hypothetical protein
MKDYTSLCTRRGEVFSSADISCTELPVSGFLFKQNHKFHNKNDRLQIGFTYNNTALKYEVSMLEFHKIKHKL